MRSFDDEAREIKSLGKELVSCDKQELVHSSLPHKVHKLHKLQPKQWTVSGIMVCDHPRGDHGVIRIWPVGSFSGSGTWNWCNVSITSRQADNSPCLKLLKGLANR